MSCPGSSPCPSTIILADNMLKDLLLNLFEQLDCNKIEYCVIGNYAELPDYTSNDVDIWVDNYIAAETILYQSAKKLGLRLYLQNKTANGSNNYFYFNNCNKEIETIKIDLMIETSYKSLVPIVSGDLIKKNRDTYNGFFVANKVIESVMHLLYPLITFGIVREKYKEKLYQINKTQEFQYHLKTIVGREHFILIKAFIEANNWHSVEMMSNSIKRYLILKMFFKSDTSRIKIFFRFIASICSRIKQKNGLVISFTGIDGAGKTSIKEYMIKNSNNFFTKNRSKEFYWRPFLLPRIAHILRTKGQTEAIDDSGKRVVHLSRLSSIANMLKYIYYSADFVLGQMKYFKQSHTGGLIVFDRYHFDNIIYPERFGFKVSKKIMLFFDRHIIPQPDIQFYFNAQPKILYERKHEIGIDEINKQQILYADEINKRGDIIEICTNGSFDNSVNEVWSHCLEQMSHRYSYNG